MIHRPFRLTEILTKMHEYKIEPKRIQFIHPYIDKEPTMVLVEGMRGAKPRVTIEPTIIMYAKDGTLLQKNGNNPEKTEEAAYFLLKYHLMYTTPHAVQSLYCHLDSEVHDPLTYKADSL